MSWGITVRPSRPGSWRWPPLTLLRQSRLRRLRRLSMRSRLTLLYGGLFLIAGGALIAILYVIFSSNFPGAPPGPGDLRPR